MYLCVCELVLVENGEEGTENIYDHLWRVIQAFQLIKVLNGDTFESWDDLQYLRQHLFPLFYRFHSKLLNTLMNFHYLCSLLLNLFDHLCISRCPNLDV